MYNLKVEPFEDLYNGETTGFLLSIDRNFSCLTGDYDEMGRGQYLLYTYIFPYQQENFSDEFLKRKPWSILDLVKLLQTNFWDKGWCHGDLDSSNVLVDFTTADYPRFRIYDFEFTETYKSYQDLWNVDIKTFLVEFCHIEVDRKNRLVDKYTGDEIGLDRVILDRAQTAINTGIFSKEIIRSILKLGVEYFILKMVMRDS